MRGSNLELIGLDRQVLDTRNSYIVDGIGRERSREVIFDEGDVCYRRHVEDSGRDAPRELVVPKSKGCKARKLAKGVRNGPSERVVAEVKAVHEREIAKVRRDRAVQREPLELQRNDSLPPGAAGDSKPCAEGFVVRVPAPVEKAVRVANKALEG